MVDALGEVEAVIEGSKTYSVYGIIRIMYKAQSTTEELGDASTTRRR